MGTSERVEEFLVERRPTTIGARDVTRLMPGTQPFVTVSSQMGAGGHRLVELLPTLIAREDRSREVFQDWRVFDRSMCEHILQDKNLAQSAEGLLHEDYHSQIAEFVTGIFGHHGMQNVAFARLSKLLRTIAVSGKVVVGGHGGVMATAGLSGGLHVRLVAPIGDRVEHVAQSLDIDQREADRLIQKRDSVQKKQLKTHYHVDVDDPEQYHLVCNTGRLSPETVGAIVTQLLHRQVD